MERAEAGDAGSSGGPRGHAMESTASTALCSHTAARAVADNLHTRSTHTAVSRYGELTPSRGVSLWGVVKRRAGGAGGVGGAKRECGR